MITPSLEDALRHLRLLGRDRRLWIDAICINQQDLTERREQVGYMRQIYSNCTSDILWLGPKRDRCIRGMEMIRKLKGFSLEQIDELASTSQEWAKHFSTSSYTGKSTETQGTKWILRTADSQAIKHLLYMNRVWRRVWIMQEVSCAPQLHLVCGDETLDWRVVDSILDSSLCHTDAFHGSFPHSSSKPLTELFGTAKSIATQRKTTAKMQKGEESTLFHVLARFRGTLATDLRDKIYGLLGLVSDTLSIEADYERSVQATYTKVTLALIKSLANLDIICQCPWQRSSVNLERRLENLPHWVPDFSRERSGTFLFAQRDIYSPGRPTCSVPCTMANSNTILLGGFCLGSLKYFDTDEREFQTRVHTADMQVHIRDLAQKYLKIHGSHNVAQLNYRTGEDQMQAFWRTLVGDCKAYPTERLTLEDVSHDQGIFQLVVSSDGKPRNIYQLRSLAMLEKLQSTLWRFGITANGLFVLAQHDAAEGDVIVILDGAKTPMVLRPKTVDLYGNVLYQPISGAYVHGFMDGEVLNMQEEFDEQVFWVI
jgi:hypothetical protein